MGVTSWHAAKPGGEGRFRVTRCLTHTWEGEAACGRWERHTTSKRHYETRRENWTVFRTGPEQEFCSQGRKKIVSRVSPSDGENSPLDFDFKPASGFSLPRCAPDPALPAAHPATAPPPPALGVQTVPGSPRSPLPSLLSVITINLSQQMNTLSTAVKSNSPDLYLISSVSVTS